ncbi:Leucine-rich receptor-like protein kinase family protein [Rhynchospora pubera]|uniref:Leucine-rich receptor-like protein kinase family protein n=1 Tax=Rhynchospora pubera TaxID=906938 RepID=A0AAV8CAR5_9POAL|nr:Leucine-rich receptor-like protein kinase family protein [Rhynchospora pubera]
MTSCKEYCNCKPHSISLSLSAAFFLQFHVMMIIMIPCFPLSAASNPQGHTLLAWKATLHLQLGDPLPDWHPSDLSPCRWSGISCDPAGRVTSLSLQWADLHGPLPSNLSALGPSLTSLVLSGANLTGPIPSSLTSQLPLLQHLDLSSNALSGPIPPDLFYSNSNALRLQSLLLHSNALSGPIPSSIGNLTSLRGLLLYDNQLSGPLPPSLGLLSSLQVLRAGGNPNLHGPIPAEIGNCTALVMLGLAETSVTGPLPSQLGLLPNLQTLALYTALLTGPIPPELGRCASLQNLYLYENKLSGPIPPQLCLGPLASSLHTLLLWQNDLVGMLPPELGRCTALSIVDFSMNALTGPIPASFANLTSLRQLQLSVNQLSGPISPDILSACTNLTDLQLDNNNFSGTVPPDIAHLLYLRTLYLWANRFTGPIPAEIGHCTNLEAIDLSQNAFTGMIPNSLFRLPRLAKLLLLDNDLSGEIPPDVGSCSSLIRFRASGNRIAGTLPKEIGMLRNLSFLDLASNHLSGIIPPEIGSCHNLTFVDLHYNSLTGSLPQDIFQGLNSIQYLDLSNNLLSGPIPSQLGLLTSLTKLVLNGNRFSGKVPVEIGSCTRLQLLDLGGNMLVGKIPPSIGNIPGLEIMLNLSSNDLSGEIPPEFAGLSRLGVLDLSHNRLTGDLHPLSVLQNLVALNISFNNFSGAVPSTPFFSKLPLADLQGNPALCVTGCASSEQSGARMSRRAARIATAVLLSATVALLGAAMFVLINRRHKAAIKMRSGCTDEEKDGDMSPPWEVTLYQKKPEIVISEVAQCLTIANVIGQGWSGTVYRTHVPANGITIAVKKFRSYDEASAEAFACEIGALARVRHRNIVRLLGWAANGRTRLLFYDYLPNGTLGSLLHGNGEGATVVEWEVRLSIAVGVADGLAYLHHDCVPAILHRDVKGDNVLLGERYEACLADFGLACAVDQGSFAASPPPFAGSYGYIAPEYGCMMKITTKSDVYSFGVVLLELLTGKRPVDPTFVEGQSLVQWVRENLKKERDPVELLDHRLQGRPDTQVQEMLQALGIALLCASTRLDDRPTMKDVAALLRGIRHEDSIAVSEARKSSIGGEVQKWVETKPVKATAKINSGHSSMGYTCGAENRTFE